MAKRLMQLSMLTFFRTHITIKILSRIESGTVGLCRVDTAFVHIVVKATVEK